MSLELTERQCEVVCEIVGYKHVCMYGGSRSGKTFLEILIIARRANRTKSRHLIARKHYSHVRQSIVHDTFPKVMKLAGINYEFKDNKSFAVLENGSEIWFAGLDSQERIDKILGNEYSTIFANEMSEIKYEIILTLLTRLAENSGLNHLFLYDENPTEFDSWSYKVFQQQVNPINKNDRLVDKGKYISVQMNPVHNMQNLNKEYLDMLDGMPEIWRNRFFVGEYQSKAEGTIFKGWEYFSGQISDGVSIIAVDPKDTGTDYWCAVHVLIKGGLAYLDDVIYTPEMPEITVPRTIEMINSNKCDQNHVEINYGGSFLLSDIQSETRHPIMPMRNQTKKLTRIITESTFINKYFRFRSDGNEEYEEWANAVRGYSGHKDQVDDGPDALAMASKVIKALFYHEFYQ